MMKFRCLDCMSVFDEPVARPTTAMSTGTFNSKVKSPEKLTLEELCDARLVCKVDKEALLETLRRIL